MRVAVCFLFAVLNSPKLLFWHLRNSLPGLDMFNKSQVINLIWNIQFNSVQLHSHVRRFVTPWTAARWASLSSTNPWSLPKLMSIESVMPSNHLILCRPLLLSPSIFPSIGVFSNQSAPHMRWPKYWSFSFNISPSKEHPGLISFRMDWLNYHMIQQFQS